MLTILLIILTMPGNGVNYDNVGSVDNVDTVNSVENDGNGDNCCRS